MLQQQQMLLRWQLEFQQKNMQFLLSMPSSDPPKPAPAVLASLTPALQPTSVNVSVQPSATIAAVSPALAAKRNRLEEMKVAELKEECRRLNIVRSGPKPNLIERLLPYADDVLSRSSSAAAASESKPVEQFEASLTSVSTTPALNISSGDANTESNIIFNAQQPSRVIPAEKCMTSPVACNTSAVPMDVDSVLCKQEPRTPDIAQPNVYPVMIMPAGNGGHVVQASVSSTVPPLIVYHPASQPLMRPANAAKQFPSIPPALLQEQMLLEQQHQQYLRDRQRQINELVEQHLQLSQQKLMQAQYEADLQRILHSDVPMWMNSAALNGSSMSASVSSVDCQAQVATTSQLLRTNRYDD